MPTQSFMMEQRCPKLDSAFNLTLTYRRDSDVIRPFSDIEYTIQRMRFHHINGYLVDTDDAYYQKLIEYKYPYGSGFNTAWIVSNCNHTDGARTRWDYGTALIKAGLKVNGTGDCFGKPTKKISSDWTAKSKHKVVEYM